MAPDEEERLKKALEDAEKVVPPLSEEQKSKYIWVTAEDYNPATEEEIREWLEHHNLPLPEEWDTPIDD